jgi:uncharacterized protein YoxC
MDSHFAQGGSASVTPHDVLHRLNNQLQILLVSTENLKDLAVENQDARQHCSTIQQSARKIAELIAALTRQNAGEDPAPAAIQEWLAEFWEKERKREPDKKLVIG